MQRNFFFAKCLHLMKFNFHFLHMQLKEGDVEKFRIACGTDTDGLKFQKKCNIGEGSVA